LLFTKNIPAPATLKIRNGIKNATPTFAKIGINEEISAFNKPPLINVARKLRHT
jgi:hypothetical protein